MASLFDDLGEPERARLKERKQPQQIVPMKAVLTEDYFSDPNWIYEPKLDGERCLAFKKGDRIDLLSRNNKRINASYPEIVEALESQRGDFVLDGEIVVFEKGAPSFARLQRRMHVLDPKRARRTGVAVFLLPFRHPLRERS